MMGYLCNKITKKSRPTRKIRAGPFGRIINCRNFYLEFYGIKEVAIPRHRVYGCLLVYGILAYRMLGYEVCIGCGYAAVVVYIRRKLGK